MRIGVLAATDSWYLTDLRRAAATQHEIVPLDFRELHSQISLPRTDAHAVQIYAGDMDCRHFDAVLVRTMPPGSLEQVVFRMDLLARLQDAGCPVINPPRAVEASVDKYLASAKLAAAGLPMPATIVCQTAADARRAFDALGGDVVVKPLFGSEGRGIARLQDTAMADRAFRLLEQLGTIIYLQQFVPHAGADLRLLVIGRQVLGMRRSNPSDWRTNVSRGATTLPIEVTPQLAELALRSADAVGAPLAGVDVLPDLHGRNWVIEVNAVPGWKALAATLHVDVARLVLEYVRSLPR